MGEGSKHMYVAPTAKSSLSCVLALTTSYFGRKVASHNLGRKGNSKLVGAMYPARNWK